MGKKINRFEDSVEIMKNVADHFIPYNFPLNHYSLEGIISPLKKMATSIDGYDIGLYLSKADYGDYYVETLQIYGLMIPFLPFNLLVKIAVRFLGGHHLSYIELPKETKKYYCWTVCIDKIGKPIPVPYEVKLEHCIYEGYEYNYISSNQFNIY